MDERWRARLGDDAVERLHDALATVFVRLPIDPPAFLPVVFPTQNGRAEGAPPGPPSHRLDGGTADLVTLLAGVLLAFTLDFEAESRLSLTIGANTLRVLGAGPARACATCPASPASPRRATPCAPGSWSAGTAR